MNPLTNTRNITKLSQRELQYNDGKTSWHDEYKDSAWIFVGGLPYDLSEGDVISIFSQYGEIVNINCIRDKVTGKFKGFGFVCYEDQRSTILAVDNFNGIKVLGRTIRVDHVKDYKPPKDSDKYDDITRQIMAQGCAPEVSAPKHEEEDEDFLLPLPEEESKSKLLAIKAEPSSERKPRDRDDKERPGSSKSNKKSKSKKSKHRKEKKRKKERSKKSKKRRSSSSESESSSSDSDSDSESSDDSKRRKRRR